MEFCIYIDDLISNIPNFHCCDCPKCPESGNSEDCPYYCFKTLKELRERGDS